MNSKAYLYIAISIPILMIVITAISIQFPNVELSPKQNFIYILAKGTDSYQCMQNARSELFPAIYPEPIKKSKEPLDCSATHIYQYNFSKNKSDPMTLDQVKQLTLSSPKQTTSADGYTINTYCDSNTISGWAPVYSVNTICLKKDNTQKRLPIYHYLNNSQDYYYFYFISWIDESKQEGINHE